MERPIPPQIFRRNPAIRFTETTRRGIKSYYLWDYYPLNRFRDVDHEKSQNRISVWNFKDGINSRQIGEYISFALLNEFGENSLRNRYFCIIPASTSQKTVSRFNSFCSIVCSNTPLNNGYNLIFSREDREAAHLNGVHQIDHSESIGIQNVAGKDIILFDDVTTSGRSFRNLRSTLIDNGASSVVGVFLAKTYSDFI